MNNYDNNRFIFVDILKKISGCIQVKLSSYNMISMFIIDLIVNYLAQVINLLNFNIVIGR